VDGTAATTEAVARTNNLRLYAMLFKQDMRC